MKTQDMLRQFINIVALSVVVAFNAISQALPLNGQTSADIANRYPDMLYFPANFAFSIWGVIYTFLAAFVIYQALPAQRENPLIRRIGYLFALSSVFNIAWLTAFHYDQYVLSMGAMILLLLTLLTLYVRVGIGVTAVKPIEKWTVHIPFSLYLGWITAATITNAGYVLTDLGWDGFGISNEVWAVIMLAVTGVLASAMVIGRRDLAYGLVIVWAVAAIAVRHSEVQMVFVTAVAVAAIVAAIILIRAFTMLRQGPSSNRCCWRTPLAHQRLQLRRRQPDQPSRPQWDASCSKLSGDLS